MSGETTIIALLALVLAAQVVLILLLRARGGKNTEQEALLRQALDGMRQDALQSTQTGMREMLETMTNSQRATAEMQDKRLGELSAQLSGRMEALQTTVNDSLGAVNKRLSASSMESEQKLEAIRKSLETGMAALREENGKKLDEMRATVDEKLQKTLEERISKSFNMVSERLEQVYKGLGEMQTLASGVGDLKKILSNVKTRGILGEIQLGAILEQIMSPEQYEENVAVKKNAERVEYAIRLPGSDDETVWLPIDAKFPADGYTALLDAYETGDKAAVDIARTALSRSIKSFAKAIHDKYIEPPLTTDFAIMFLPFEGLYAEVVKAGLVEPLQRDYKVNIAGPTTMAALLNSLQMGFKTLAIQKHSGEVWNILGAVKTEFDKFGGILAKTQERLNQANVELDKLVGVRTRVIQRKLRGVEKLPENYSSALLDIDELGGEAEEELLV